MRGSIRGAIAALLFAISVPAQAPSAKDLRTLLSADIKTWEASGHLVAGWTLKAKEQTPAFESEPANANTFAVDGFHLHSTTGKPAALTFRELRFTQPAKISLEAWLTGRSSTFLIALVDTEDPLKRTFGAVNFAVFRDSARRMDCIASMADGKPTGTPAYTPTAYQGGESRRVTLELKGTDLQLSVGSIVVAKMPGFSYRSFGVAFIAQDGEVTVRDLTLDCRVVPETMRKLTGSLAAKSKGAAGEVKKVVSEIAWRTLEREMSKEPLSAAAVAEIDALPDEVKDRVHQGMKEMAEDRVLPAVSYLRDAHERAAASPVVDFLLAQAYLMSGTADEALPLLEGAVAGKAGFPELWMSLGALHEQLGHPDKAVEFLGKAQAVEPKDPWSHVVRARVFQSLGKLAEAEADLQAAQALRPNSKAIEALIKNMARIRSRPDWKTPFKKEGKNYTVECGISPKYAADMASRLTCYRVFLEKAFPLPIEQKTPSRVWIFDSEEEYQQFSATLDHRIEHSLGLYHPTIKTLLLIANVDDEATRRTLYHEAFHQYLDLAVSRAPHWFNEGLAEYYGATSFDVSGRPTEGGILKDRLLDLRRGKFEPFKRIMLMSPAAFMNPETVSLHYAQSWAMVHYFRRGMNLQATRQFDLYTKAILAGKNRDEAWAASFGAPSVDIDSIESAFADYVTGLIGGR